MRLILYFLLLANACLSFAASEAVLKAGHEGLPSAEKTMAHVTRRLLATDKDDDGNNDTGDDDENSENGGEDSKSGNDDDEPDTPSFAIQTDVDDPQGIYIPLEKLKTMIPGPGVKPMPMVPASPADVKDKKQPVKKRRRRSSGRDRSERGVKKSSQVADYSFPRVGTRSEDANQRLFVSPKYISKRTATTMSKAKVLARNLIMEKGQFKTIQEKLGNGYKHDLRKRGAESNENMSDDKHRTQTVGQIDDNGFGSKGDDGDDHRTKEWLKKELHSIEMLMNATKRRIGKQSSGTKVAIPSQLERDLQKIDHDIHIDLKHVSNKPHQGDEKSADGGDVINIRHKASGDKGGFESTITQSKHGYPKEHEINIVHHRKPKAPGQYQKQHQYHLQDQHGKQQSDKEEYLDQQLESRRYTQDAQSPNTVHVNLKQVFQGESYQNENDVGMRQRKRDDVGHDRISEPRGAPGLTNMLRELEWIKHETDAVRRKTQQLERHLNMGQRGIERRHNIANLNTQREGYPEEHNIRVTLSHGSKSKDPSQSFDYSHHQAGEIHSKHPNERNNEMSNKYQFRVRYRDKGSPSLQNHKPVVHNKDNTIVNTFNRLQQDLKTLQIKMNAKEKFDGKYISGDSETLPKVPIFNSKYFNGEQDQSVLRDGNDEAGSEILEELKEEDKGYDNSRKAEAEDVVSEDDLFRARKKRSASTRSNQEVTNLNGHVRTIPKVGAKKEGKVEQTRLSQIDEKLDELKSKLYILKRLRHRVSTIKGVPWQTYRRIAEKLKRKWTVYLVSCIRFFSNNPIEKMYDIRAFKNKNKLQAISQSGNLLYNYMKNVFTYLVNRSQGPSARKSSNNGHAIMIKPLKLTFFEPHSNNTYQRYVMGNKISNNKVNNMRIERHVRNGDKRTQNKHRRSTPYAFPRERIQNVQLVRIRRKTKQKTKMEPVSKEERKLAKEFSQLLALIPKSEEEQDIESKLYKNDLKEDNAFDINAAIKKVDKEDGEDADFLKQSVESSYLLANSKIRRRRGLSSSTKSQIIENGRSDFKQLQKMHNPPMLAKRNRRAMRKRRDIATTSSDVTTTTTRLGAASGNGVETDEGDDSSLQGEKNILDRNVLHMMDYYEGKGGNPNLRKKRAAVKKHKDSHHHSAQSSHDDSRDSKTRQWLESQMPRIYPHIETDNNFDPKYEPPYLDTYFPKAYGELKNARDRLRWFRLLDGEDRLARQVGYLNNMADRLLDEETDPVLMYLSHTDTKKDPDDFRTWVLDPVPSYNGRTDILQEAIHDYNNNEHERNAYQYPIRKRRETPFALKQFKYESVNDVTDRNKNAGVNNNGDLYDSNNNDDNGNNDINNNNNNNNNNNDNYNKNNNVDNDNNSNDNDNNDNDNNNYDHDKHRVGAKGLEKLKAKKKAVDDYQFDESQMGEFDDVDDDDDDDDVDDDDVGDDGEGESESTYKANEEADEYDDDKEKNDNDDEDDADDENDQGIEVVDDKRQIETEEPFAYIERETSPKKKASKEPEYFWGSWSPCSETCGIGQRFRSNMCGQGQPCSGKQASTETEVCADILEC